MEFVQEYLSDETISKTASGIKLQIELMHLWSTLLNYDLASEYFVLVTFCLNFKLLHFISF